eukprot:COSAG05_NODE_22617_length_263_cov_1.054878_1_plen_20_part_10
MGGKGAHLVVRPLAARDSPA